MYVCSSVTACPCRVVTYAVHGNTQRFGDGRSVNPNAGRQRRIYGWPFADLWDGYSTVRSLSPLSRDPGCKLCSLAMLACSPLSPNMALGRSANTNNLTFLSSVTLLYLIKC